jgi:hypothetical protein
MQDFRDLDVWKKSHQLTLTIYRITKPFPDDERFGLTSQTRMASASIGAIWLKAADVELTLISHAMCKSRWVQHVRLSITCSWQEIWSTFQAISISRCKMTWQASSGCSLRYCES